MLESCTVDMVVRRETTKTSRVGSILESLESGLDSDLASDWIVRMSSVCCFGDCSLTSVVGAGPRKESKRSGSI